MLSPTRDMAAAQRFFRSTLAVTDRVPGQVTSDGHDSYPRAIQEVLGHNVEHRCSAYLNRRIEQDHRGVKQRYYPMLGLVLFIRRNASVERSKSCGNISVRDAKEGNSYQPLETDVSLSREYRHLKRCSPPNQVAEKETSGYSSSM